MSLDQFRREIIVIVNKLTLEELKKIAEQTAFHASVIIAQRDPSDTKMDVRSALLHRLWIRICGKINLRAGGYPNRNDDTTHDSVLTSKIREVCDKHLESPLSDGDFEVFINDFINSAFKHLEKA